jgi:hypothetical protein
MLQLLFSMVFRDTDNLLLILNNISLVGSSPVKRDPVQILATVFAALYCNSPYQDYCVCHLII